MPNNAAIFTELGDRVQAAMARLSVPGVAVGVLCGDEEYTAGFGVINIDNPLPVDTDTMFQIGSTTKTVTGTVVMRLVEEGRLDLDTPVRTYLPDLRLSDEGVAGQVAMRHLLTHTGGWVGDVFDDTGWGDDALAQMVGRLAEVPQVTPLGELFSYNNAGFYIAGRVIEAVTGQPYERVVHERLLTPLGMSRSFFFPDDIMTYRFATGHIVRDGQPTIARPWALARNANAVGGLSSSVTDQLRYARFHLGDGTAPDGTRLLSPDSMRLMQTPNNRMDRFGGWRGITWALREVGGVRTVAHGGATNGQLSAFIMAPDQRFAITVLTNADKGAQLHAEATKWALEQFVGAVDPTPTHQTLSDAQLREYAGHYTGALVTIDLEANEGGLVMRQTPTGGFPKKDSPPGPTPPPVRLAFIGPDQVIGLDAPAKDVRCEFIREDGQVRWFHIGGRIRRKAS